MVSRVLALQPCLLSPSSSSPSCRPSCHHSSCPHSSSSCYPSSLPRRQEAGTSTVPSVTYPVAVEAPLQGEGPGTGLDRCAAMRQAVSGSASSTSPSPPPLRGLHGWTPTCQCTCQRGANVVQGHQRTRSPHGLRGVGTGSRHGGRRALRPGKRNPIPRPPCRIRTRTEGSC